MVRITPQDLQGSPVSRAAASPTDQFGLQGGGGPGSRPLPPQLIGFAGLSRTLARIARARQDSDDVMLEEIGAEVASLQQQGLEEEEILKRVIKGGHTPKRIAALLRNSPLEEIDNPAFQMGLQSRRAQSKLIIYEGLAKDARAQLAVELQGAQTVAEKQRVIEAALSNLRTENEALFEDIGPFGSATVERGLTDIHTRFVAGADEVARVEAQKEYRRLLSESVVAGAEQLITTQREDGSLEAGAQSSFVRSIGTAYDQARLDGSKSALEDAYQAAQAAITRVAQNVSYGEAKELAEKILYDTQDANRNRIFDDDPDILLKFNQRLSQLERESENETDRKDTQRARARAATSDRIANSDGMSEITATAIEEGFDAALTKLDNAILDIADGTEAGLELFGVDEENKGFAIQALRDERARLVSQASSSMGLANRQREEEQEAAARVILDQVWKSGQMPSKDDYFQLTVERRGAVRGEARAILENEGLEAYRRANGDGMISSMAAVIGNSGAKRNPITGEVIQEDAIRIRNIVVGEVRSRALNDDAFAEKLRTEPGAAIEDVRKEMSARFPSQEQTEQGTEITSIVGEEAATTGEGKVRAAEFEQNSAAAPGQLTAGASPNLMGGRYRNEPGTEDLAKVTDRILKRTKPYRPATPETAEILQFGGSSRTIKSGGPKRSPLWNLTKDIRRISTLGDVIDVDAAKTDALLRSGVMSMADTRADTPADLATELDGRFKMEGAFADAVSDMSEFDFAGINPYAVRFTDFTAKGAEGWFEKDGLQGQSYKTTARMPKAIRAQIIEWLESQGAAVSDATIAQFAANQYLHWNR